MCMCVGGELKRMNRRSEGQSGIGGCVCERKTGLQSIPATSRINKKAACRPFICMRERAGRMVAYI